MQIGDSVVYVTPDQHDEDATAVITNVRSDTVVDLTITFADGSQATSFFVDRGSKSGRWHPIGEAE